MTDSPEELVRSALSPHFKSIDRITLVSDSNNLVYYADTEQGKVVFKAYRPGKGVHDDLEVYVRGKVPSATKFFRKLIAVDSSRSIFPGEFIVLAYVKGSTIREILQQGRLSSVDIPALTAQLIELIDIVTATHMEGCGFVRPDGTTSHKEWFRFLLDYQSPSIVSLLDKQFDSELCARLYSIIVRRNALFRISDFKLLPIDLNLDNLLVNEGGSLVCLDPGGVAAGDRLFAIGEYVGHTYTTPLCQPFLDRLALSPEDLRKVHMYAAIMNSNVLAFVAKHTSANLEEAKPWGNNTTFKSLIAQHLADAE